MYATLVLNALSQVQGLVVEAHEDGQVSVSIGERVFKGWPVARPKSAAQSDRKPELEHA